MWTYFKCCVLYCTKKEIIKCGYGAVTADETFTETYWFSDFSALFLDLDVVIAWTAYNYRRKLKLGI